MHPAILSRQFRGTKRILSVCLSQYIPSGKLTGRAVLGQLVFLRLFVSGSVASFGQLFEKLQWRQWFFFSQ
jgi:hypothetical protein